ncbi:MAG: MBL fold metallo-hydrolase [Bacteroidota bacterium]
MQKHILIFLMMAQALALTAQRAEPDRFTTSEGDLLIQPIIHGTLAFTWKGKTVYVDPYGGAKAFEGIAPPDLILITDIHGDHLNLETLAAIDVSKAMLLAPRAVVEMLPYPLKVKATSLANGQSATIMGLQVAALPMYNLPEAPDSRHPKGRGNGYVVTLADKKLYFSGDTEDIPEMRSLKGIDVAFVCMNQPFTMDIHQAASAVLAFKPNVVYPYHYRGQGRLSDVDAFKKTVDAEQAGIEVRLRNWYPNY